MEQDNGWYERGELPPVGAECEYIGQDGKSESRVYDEWLNGDPLEVLAIVEACDGSSCPVVYNKRHRSASMMDEKFLRPLKTEREKFVDRVLDEWAKSNINLMEFLAKQYDKGLRYTE